MYQLGVENVIISHTDFTNHFKKSLKIRRGPKLEGYAFANFGNSSGTEGKPSQKREKNGEKKKKKSMLHDWKSNP